MIIELQEYWDFHSEITEHTNNLRSALKRIDSAAFESLWNKSTANQRKEVKKIIHSGSRQGLKDWMSTHPGLKADEWGYTRLRNRAKDIGVLNYSRLTRDELIRKVVEKESANEKSRDVVSDNGDAD